MEHNVIPFMYEANEVRTILDEEGNPWFVARDVCNILSLEDTGRALEKLDDDEKLTRKVFGSGQERDVWSISESGLYTLIIRSNKPEAKPFRRWVTHEVLPSIRKTGFYEAREQESDVLSKHQLAEVAYRVKQIMIMTRAFGYKGARGKLIANDVIRDAIGVDPLSLLGVKDEVLAEYESTHRADEDDRLPVLMSPNVRLDKKTLADFVEACCTVQEELIESAMKLYQRFDSWYAATRGIQTAPSQKAFGLLMSAHFQKFKGGTYFYKGIRLKEETADLRAV